MKEKITLRYIVAIFLVLLLVPAYAQVGVGTLTPHSSAKLEVVSDSSGVLLTRMTYAQMNAISNPADGLLVYCTDDAGFFVYQNSQWQKVGIQNLSISGDSLKIDKSGTGVNLASFVDNAPKIIAATGTGNYHFGLNNMDSIQSGASRNIAIGDLSLYYVTNGDFNIGLGYATNRELTSGYGNIAIGTQALKNGTTGFDNIGIGRDVGEALTTGNRNVLIGKEAGHSLTTGALNTFIGNRAGYEAQTNHSVFIGSFAGWAETTDQMLYIENTSDSIPLIGGSFNNQIVGINMPADSLLSGATLQVGGDISLENGGAIDEFSTDTTLAGNSDLAVPTEKAIKTYVDGLVSGAADNMGNHTAIQNLDLGANKLVGNGGTTGISIASDGRLSLALGDSINEFSTDSTLAGNSDLAIPTEKAVKTYVDSLPRLVDEGRRNYHSGLYNMEFLDTSTANANLAIGQEALYNLKGGTDNAVFGIGAAARLTNAIGNVALGHYALQFDTTGHYNTTIGWGAGRYVQGDSNVMIGYDAGSGGARADLSPRGSGNTFIGTYAGFGSTTEHSVFIGRNAGMGAPTDSMLYIENTNRHTPLIGGSFSKDVVGINVPVNNTAFLSGATLQVGGDIALENGGAINEFSTDTTLAGNSDLAVPTEKAIKTYVDHLDGSVTNEIQNLSISGDSLVIDKAGTGVDLASFVDNVPRVVQEPGLGNYHFDLNNMDSLVSGQGNYNLALGLYGLNSVTSGDNNVSLGSLTNQSLTTGGGNIAINTHALKNNVSGNGNIGIGRGAGVLTTGSYNVLIGDQTGHNTTGHRNTFIGSNVGVDAQTNLSVFLGHYAGYYEDTDQMLYIENSADSIPLIGGSFNNQIVGINMPADSLLSGATLQVGGDIALENGSAINEFSTDASLAGNSDLAVPTEKAVKTYVDNAPIPKIITATGIGNYHFGLNNMDSINSIAVLNLALGDNSLHAVTTGNYNIGVGSSTMSSLTSGYGNVAIGTQALKNGTTGYDNIGIGRDVGEALTTGNRNVLVGKEAGKALTTGALNTFIGNRAGYEAQTNSSVFIGSFAGWGETTDHMLYIENSGDSIPLIGGRFDRKIVGINMPAPELNSGAILQVGGDIALENGGAIDEFSTDASLAGNSDLAVPTEKAVKTYVDNAPRVVQEPGTENYHFGLNNMGSIASGAVRNIALGDSGLYALTTGDYNIAIGTRALENNKTDTSNVAIGRKAGGRVTGNRNTLIGDEAGWDTREYGNTFVGRQAGKHARTDGSVFIGHQAGYDEDRDRLLYIENSTSSTPLIGGNFFNDIVGINTPVVRLLLGGPALKVNGDASKSVAGNWSANSDKRLKTNINYMQSEEMLQKMLALKGVSYEWNDTVTGITRPEGIQYGFIAQDLEKVWPSKISKDGQGYLMTSYGDYDPMFVESIKALYQRITELETEKQQLQGSLNQAQSSLSQAEKEQASIRSEMSKTKSEREELRNEMDDIKKKLLRRLSVQQAQAQK